MRVSIYDPISLSQGTVFVPSSTNDLLTKTLYDTDLQVSPSCFVCINLPAWQPTAEDVQTFYYPANMFGLESVPSDANILVPALLQNYWDNLSLYATDLMTAANDTFVERAFWKMLQNTKTFVPTVENGSYVEQLVNNWQPIVTYVGKSLNLGLQTINGQTFNEMFLYIPRNAKRVQGAWKTQKAAGLENLTQLPEEFTENAVGLKAGDAQFVKALYDIDFESGEMSTAYSIGNAVDDLLLDFDNCKVVDGDIEFNAILIYADVWSLSNPDIPKQKVLHSILVIDKFQTSGGASDGVYRIPTMTKKVESDSGSANALAFRVCTRMTGCNTSTSPIEVTSVDGVSLDMYMQAVSRMQNQLEQIDKMSRSIAQMQKRLDEFVVGFAVNENAMEAVNALKKQLLEQGTTVSPAALLDMFIEVSRQMKAQDVDKQIICSINVTQTL